LLPDVLFCDLFLSLSLRTEIIKKTKEKREKKTFGHATARECAKRCTVPCQWFRDSIHSSKATVCTDCRRRSHSLSL
jgi:hypothetical protein